MKPLNEQQVKQLLKAGLFMYSEHSYYNYNFSQNYSYNYNFETPEGYPVAMGTKDFEKYNPGFPYELLLSYEVKEKNRPMVTNMGKEKIYIFPLGLPICKGFSRDNETVTSKLKEWNDLARTYSEQKLESEELAQTEEKLLEIYRDIYGLVHEDKLVNKSLADEEVLFNYLGGHNYLYKLKMYLPKIYQNIDKNNDIKTLEETFYEMVENEEDLIAFEKAAIQVSKKGNTRDLGNRYLEIYNNLYPIWYKLCQKVYKEQNTNKNSLFFQQFKTYLDKYELPGKEIINIFKTLETFDSSILKDYYIETFNTSNKKAVVQHVEKYLKKHDIFPEINENLVLEEKYYVAYKNKITFNYQLLKDKVKNNPMAGETLVKIVENTFRGEEKNCLRLVSYIKPETGRLEFIVESLEENLTKVLSERLTNYFSAIISPEFMTPELLKKISKNGINRIHYESDKDIIESYKNAKNIIIMKNKLESELSSKEKSVRNNKKI